MRYTRDFGSPLPPAWTDLPDRDRYWTEFEERFGFRPGMKPESWPAIAEPTPSVTFDLINTAGTRGSWRARFDAVNAEALRCFGRVRRRSAVCRSRLATSRVLVRHCGALRC